MKGLWLPLLTFTLAGCSAGALLREQAQNESWYRDEREYLSAQAAPAQRSLLALEPDVTYWKQVQPIVTRLHQAVQDEARGELENRFHLRIVRTDLVNALTLPNGRIYVTTGLLQLVDHEAALAGVLAHEMAHYLLSHASHRLDRNLVAMAMSSPDDELEADREGLRIAKKAGFAPQGLIQFLKRVQSLERRSGMRFGGFLTSHPDVGRRVEAQEKLIGAEANADLPPARAEFRALKLALYERKEKYSPTLRAWDVEVPGLGPEWGLARERLRLGLDLTRVHDQLMNWVERTDLSREARQVVTLALIEQELGDGHWQEADAWLKRIESEGHADLGSWVLRCEWLLGEEGLASLWERIEQVHLDPQCSASQDCLSAALIWAGRTRMDPRRLDGLRAKLAPGSLRHSVAANWEEVLAIRLALRDPESRPAPKPLTQDGFRTPSRLLLDWRALDQDLRDRGLKIKTHEWGTTLSVTGALTGMSGAVGNLLGTGTSWGIASGVENWPYTGGWALNWGGGDARLSPSYTTRDWSVWGKWDWGEGRLRPWTGAALGYEWVDDRSVSGQSVGGGLIVRAQSGVDFRFARSPSRSEVWASARVALRGDTWTSTTGFQASGVGWEVALALFIRTDRGPTTAFNQTPGPDIETGEMAFQAPPVFY